MISCTLGDKRYTVDFVNARTLRKIGEAMDAWNALKKLDEARAADPNTSITGEFEKHLDVMVCWFCDFLFKGQFNAEELYDGYPSAQLTHDIYIAMMSVYTNSTELLNEFPMKPAAKENA